MNLAGAAWAVLVLWGGGFAARRVRGAGHRPDPVLDFAAGVVLLTVVQTILVVLGLTLSVAVQYGVFLLLALLGLTASGRGDAQHGAESPARDAPSPSASVVALLLVAAVAAVLAVLAGAAVEDRLWWDGWAHWAFRGHAAVTDATLVGPVALDPRYAFAHPEYPPAVPLVDWWVFRHAGGPEPPLASLLGVVWTALLALLLHRELTERCDGLVAGAAALGLVSFYGLTFYAIGGTADIVIALALAGILAALLPRRGGTGGDFLAAAVFASLGVLAKPEGLALAAILAVVSAVAVDRRSASLRDVAPALSPFLALAPWIVVRTSHGIAGGAVVSWPGPGALSARVGEIGDAIVAQALQPQWSLPLILGALGAAEAITRGGPGVRRAWTVLAGYAAVLGLVYLLTPHSLAWLLSTSFSRTTGALVPAGVLLALAGPAEP